jgi:hypothetical protein
MIDPGVQAGVLRAVLPRDQERAKLDFEDRDGGEEARRWARALAQAGSHPTSPSSISDSWPKAGFRRWKRPQLSRSFATVH